MCDPNGTVSPFFSCVLFYRHRIHHKNATFPSLHLFTKLWSISNCRQTLILQVPKPIFIVKFKWKDDKEENGKFISCNETLLLFDNEKQLKSFNPLDGSSNFEKKKKPNKLSNKSPFLPSILSPAHGNRHGLMHKTHFHFDYVHGE